LTSFSNCGFGVITCLNFLVAFTGEYQDRKWFVCGFNCLTPGSMTLGVTSSADAYAKVGR
jgi:hypothetical protein